MMSVVISTDLDDLKALTDLREEELKKFMLYTPKTSHIS